MTHDKIKMCTHRFMPDYFCLADEISSTGTYHIHLFIYSSSPIRFSTLKDRFPIAHIEKAYGTVKENRDYIMKAGKWENSEKAETSIEETFEEWGHIPEEKAEKNPVNYQLIQDIQEGKRTAEIIEKTPSLAFRVKDIDTLRQTLLAEKYSKEIRKLEVTYLYGATGTGKTKGIYDKFPSGEICRITNYRNGNVYFDSYAGQDVLVLEEFCSQISIEDLLNILDIYPLMLPAQYSDKVACYTKVF